MELENKIINELSYMKKRFDAIMENKKAIVDLYVAKQRRHHEIEKGMEEEFYNLVKEELKDFLLQGKKVEQIFEKSPYQLNTNDEKVTLTNEKEFGKFVNEIRDTAIHLEAHETVDLKESIKELIDLDEVDAAEESKTNLDYITYLNQHLVDFTVELHVILDMELEN